MNYKENIHLGGSVLIVTDYFDTTEVLWRQLEADGFSINNAPPDALGDIDLATFRLVIVQFGAECGVENLQLVQEIKFDLAGSDTLLLVISTSANNKMLVEALNSGADDYIILPCSGREFVARVHAHIRARKAI